MPSERHNSCFSGILATAEGAPAIYALKGNELYVRARIVSSKHKEGVLSPDEMEQAWTQSVVTGVGWGGYFSGGKRAV